MNANHENPNLDLLRATAVLYVFFFHLLLFGERSTHLPVHLDGLGQWGVLIFFVHTSLVLMYSMERMAAKNPTKGLYLPFLIRRCFRIYPLSMVIVLTVFFCKLPVAHLRGGIFLGVHLDPAGLLSNLFLYQNLTQTESIVAPLWSLPIEMNMYLVLPLLFIVVRYLSSLAAILLLWMLTVAAAALAAHSIHLQRYGLEDFLIYVPCFFAGVVAYQFSKRSSLQLPFFLWPVTIAVLTALCLWNPLSYAGPWFLCLLLGIAIPQFREMSNPWLKQTCLIIAKYSYGIYLTHFILIWWAFQGMGQVGRPFQWFLFLSATVSLPVFLYHVIEEPMINLGARIAKHVSSERVVSRTPVT
ncbi:MAG TPA: acyltransferase [Candidatus Saccharimonadales bacterium]|nr:acyltransferase [Candidatus Saccharimonadales bacterium]